MDAPKVTLDLKIAGMGLQNLSVGVWIGMEGDFSHGVGDLPILHETLPHKAAAQVFCHQHADTHVDTDHVFSIPSGFWLEGVGESIASVQLIAIPVAHR